MTSYVDHTIHANTHLLDDHLADLISFRAVDIGYGVHRVPISS